MSSHGTNLYKGWCKQNQNYWISRFNFFLNIMIAYVIKVLGKMKLEREKKMIIKTWKFDILKN